MLGSVNQPIVDGNYYLSESGDDLANGKSPSTAWKTLTKLESEKGNLIAGDIVNFNGGDKFFGTLDLTGATNGTALEKITFQSYGTGKAKITGAKELTGFTHIGGDIWEVDTNGDFVYHVIKDDSYSISARYPKYISDYSYNGNFAQITSSPIATQIVVPDFIGLADISGATIFWQSRAWLFEQAIVESFDTLTGTVTLDSSPVFSLSGFNHCYVTNHESFLENESEWFYDSVNGKLKIYSTTEPTGIEIVTVDDNGITHAEVSNYNFKDIDVYGYQKQSFYSESANDNLEFDNVTMRNCSLYGWRSEQGTNITMKNSEVIQCGQGGLNLSNVTAYDNDFNRICMVKDYSPYIIDGQDRRSQFAFRCTGDSDVYYNRLDVFGYNGITPAGGPVHVHHNYITNGLLDLDDGGLIYCYGASLDTTGMIFENNIVLGREDYPTTDGDNEKRRPIYLDEQSRNVIVRNNTALYGTVNIYQNEPNNAGGDNDFIGNNMYLPDAFCHTMKRGSQGDFTGNHMFTIHNKQVVYYDTATFNGTMDNNRYFNPNAVSIVKVEPTNYTISEWKTFTGQEANSTDDTGLTITAHQCVYNTTKETVVESFVGTWYDLDGNSYTNSISLAEFTGKILIQY